MKEKEGNSREGFTLVEVMITTFIAALTLGSVMTAFISALGFNESGMAWYDKDHRAIMAMERVLRGTDNVSGMREFHANEIDFLSSDDGWVVWDKKTNEVYVYSAADKTIQDQDSNIIVSQIADSSALLLEDRTMLSLTIAMEGSGKSGTPSAEYTTMIQFRN